METPILQIQQLNKVFSLAQEKCAVINNITLSFSQSGFVLISGKSGSGKSTLLNLIAGIIKPTTGHVVFEGRPVDEMAEKHICAYRNREIGYIFQHYNLFDKQSALFNVILPLLIDGRGIDKAYEMGRILMREYGMEKLANQEVGKLSGGEKQRIAVLRAVISNPSLVLADEPTGALDRQNAIKTMEMLQEISKQKIVIVVSHDVDLAKNYASRHIILHNGAIAFDSLFNEIKQ